MYLTRDDADPAKYMAQIESATTFKGQISCSGGEGVFKGFQVIDYQALDETYSLKYPVEVESKANLLCSVGLKPPLDEVKKLLDQDKRIIQDSITAALAAKVYPDEATERQQALAKRIAAVIQPSTVKKVALEVNEDLTTVKKTPPLVKVPHSAAPVATPTTLVNDDAIVLQQISGQ